MTEDSAPTLADLADGIRTAMLTLRGPEGLQGRPMTVQRIDGNDAVWFLAGDTADWLPAVEGSVNVSFVDDRTWVSVAGTGSTTRDRAVLEDLGDPISDAWFDGEADPVAVRVAVDHVDHWTAPGKLGQVVGLVKGVVADGPPDLGERGSID